VSDTKRLVEFTWNDGTVMQIQADQVEFAEEKNKLIKEVEDLIVALDQNRQQKYRIELILQQKQKQIVNLNRKIKL
jgi:hypothetical protein